MKKAKQKRPGEQRFPITFLSVPNQTLREAPKAYFAFSRSRLSLWTRLQTDIFWDSMSIGCNRQRRQLPGVFCAATAGGNKRPRNWGRQVLRLIQVRLTTPIVGKISRGSSRQFPSHSPWTPGIHRDLFSLTSFKASKEIIDISSRKIGTPRVTFREL
jgi:hypothetical protein